jgi:hypothetical protein
VKGSGDPELIGRSQVNAEPDPDAERAAAGERQQAEAEAEVGREDVRPALSLMARVFASAEHTPLYVITFLTVICLVAWISLAIWGPDTPRMATVIDTMGKAFTFFIGLFAGILGSRRRS